MIKKISLILLLCIAIVSCGKKGDPEYKDSVDRVDIKIILFKNA